MNRPTRTPTLKRAKRDSPPTVPSVPEEPPIINPSLQAKYSILQEKLLEVENIEKISTGGCTTTNLISEYCDRIEDLSTGMQGISNTLAHWGVVFSVMSEMNGQHQDGSDGEWVRLDKSLTTPKK